MVLMGFLDIRNTNSVNKAHAMRDSMKNVIYSDFYHYLIIPASGLTSISFRLFTILAVPSLYFLKWAVWIWLW